jgi:hypothetical protein
MGILKYHPTSLISYERGWPLACLDGLQGARWISSVSMLKVPVLDLIIETSAVWPWYRRSFQDICRGLWIAKLTCGLFPMIFRMVFPSCVGLNQQGWWITFYSNVSICSEIIWSICLIFFMWLFLCGMSVTNVQVYDDWIPIIVYQGFTTISMELHNQISWQTFFGSDWNRHHSMYKNVLNTL